MAVKQEALRVIVGQVDGNAPLFTVDITLATSKKEANVILTLFQRGIKGDEAMQMMQMIGKVLVQAPARVVGVEHLQ